MTKQRRVASNPDSERIYELEVSILSGPVTEDFAKANPVVSRNSTGAYAGVPFLTGFVNLCHLRSEAVTNLLDDYLNDWPMLGELGDRPREWLDPRGRGMAPLSIEQARRQP